MSGIAFGPATVPRPARPRRRRCIRRRQLFPVVALLSLVAAATTYLALLLLPYQSRHSIRLAVVHTTRPLWDHHWDAPSTLLAHYHAEGVAPDDEAACRRHGWSMRPDAPLPAGQEKGVGVGRKRRLFDVTMLHTELDLLELRLKELWDVVDTFVVAESTHNFFGEPKNLSFFDNQARFDPFRAKLVHYLHQGRELRAGDGAYTLVDEMREAVGEFLETRVRPEHGDLVLMSDVDELPRRASLALVKACNTPLPLHLQMRNFVYSFEFASEARSWRAQVHEWKAAAGDEGDEEVSVLDQRKTSSSSSSSSPDEGVQDVVVGKGPGSRDQTATKGKPRLRNAYTHAKSTDVALADAGWHCRLCYRHLWEYEAKLRSAALHFDRHEPLRLTEAQWAHLTEPETLRTRLCQGSHLLGGRRRSAMQLEVAHTWSDVWEGLLLLQGQDVGRGAGVGVSSGVRGGRSRSGSEAASSVAVPPPPPPLGGYGANRRRRVGVTDAPSALVRESTRYAFLLPGGCARRAP